MTYRRYFTDGYIYIIHNAYYTCTYACYIHLIYLYTSTYIYLYAYILIMYFYTFDILIYIYILCISYIYSIYIYIYIVHSIYIYIVHSIYIYVCVYMLMGKFFFFCGICIRCLIHIWCIHCFSLF